MSVFRIPEFYGIQQQKDGTLLPVGAAREAFNMETGDGNLTVAKAFRTIVAAPPAESGEVWHALFAFERANGKDILIGCSNRRVVFALTDYQGAVSWKTILRGQLYTPANRDSAFDAQIANIAGTNYILLATGGTRILKLPIDELSVGNPVYEWFGSGTYYLGNGIAIDGVDTTTVTESEITVTEGTLSETNNATFRLRALLYGLYIMSGSDVSAMIPADKIKSISSDGLTITADLTGITVTASNTIQLRGGVSDKAVGSLELYHDRLWSAGDPEFASRLYWSCPAGEGRTVEDWFSDDYDEDASGGHVEVDAADGDRIVALKAMNDCLLIFKVNSIWRLYGTRPSNYTLERVSDEVGAYDDKEIITRYGTPFWLTKNGIFYYDGTTAMHADNGVDYLHDLFWEVNGAARRSACSIPALNKLYFSVQSDSVGRFLLSRDLVTGAYLAFNGVRSADIATASDELLILTENGAVLSRGEHTETISDFDTGDLLDAVWKSEVMDLGGLHGTKQITGIWLRAKGGRFCVILHTDISDTVSEISPTKEIGIYKIPFSGNEARTFQIEIRNRNGSRFSIEGGITILYTARYEA